METVTLVRSQCHCCGRYGYQMARFGVGARIHFDCWDEHHSDPTTEWPVGHVCTMEVPDDRA